MRLIKKAITRLASEGRVTLQIPENLDYGKEVTEDMFSDFPDTWFTRLKSSKLPVIGKKEWGYLFLSESGWKINKKDIKKAFENAAFKRGTWGDFELHAEQHFLDVKIALDKRIDYFEKKVKEAQKVKKSLINGKGNIF